MLLSCLLLSVSFSGARRQELTNLQVHKRFRSALEEYDPDLVVSVHPLCQEIPLRVMKKMGGGSRDVPFVTVVTDLGGAHPTWWV